jgi:predicted nucleic acid-binding protein
MAVRLLDLLRETNAVDIEWLGSDRFEQAEADFRKHLDQGFSFTDCTSFVVMRERRIRQAVTTDAHFRIAGFAIVPAELSSR